MAELSGEEVGLVLGVMLIAFTLALWLLAPENREK